jgi:hypothetical protein
MPPVGLITARALSRPLPGLAATPQQQPNQRHHPSHARKGHSRVKHFATKTMEARITMAVTFSTPKAMSNTISAQQQLKQ